MLLRLPEHAIVRIRKAYEAFLHSSGYLGKQDCKWHGSPVLKLVRNILLPGVTDAGQDDHPGSFIRFQVTKRIEGHEFVPCELRLTKIGEGKMTVGVRAMNLANEIHIQPDQGIFRLFPGILKKRPRSPMREDLCTIATTKVS